MFLLIDNYDSFSHNLLDYCQQIQPNCRLIRNDEYSLEAIEEMEPEGFIFSPGPGEPKDHPLMLNIMKKWYREKPILGICLGFQAIAEYFGAQTIRANYPVHGKTSQVTHIGDSAFSGVPKQFRVTRYHSLMITGVTENPELKVTAFTEKDSIPMAIAHQNLPIWGFQYHPEAILTEYGLTLLSNWFEHIKAPIEKIS